MPNQLSLESFLADSNIPLLDVRTPAEFLQGHIPGSLSWPLFTDQERILIGTTYKKQGHVPAVELGLEIISPKVLDYLEEGSRLCQGQANVLCWRGGMRSGFAALLLETAGISTFTLIGGYKSFRRSVLQLFEKIAIAPPRLRLLSGLTGTGKTTLLQSLKAIGEQTIDLEQLSNHRGSSFGGIGMPPQPTQEHFENLLAFQLKRLNWNRPVWMEDESSLIGTCHIPSQLFRLMQQSPKYSIECPLADRLNNLMKEYGTSPPSELIEATRRITKKLGSEMTKQIVQKIENREIKEALQLLLIYYDKSYKHQHLQGI